MLLLGPRVSVTHKRVTRTVDGIGGYTESWATIETFNAILNPMTPEEALQYSKDTVTRMYNLYIEVNSRTIREQDRIYFGSKECEILGVLNPFEQNLFYKIILKEVN